MIDRSFIGHTPPDHTILVEKGQLILFAQAIGETDPIYFEEAAARTAGFPSLPAPPTFCYSLYLLQSGFDRLLAKIVGNSGLLLHGEQHFEYLKPIFAGDTICFQSKITDIHTKRAKRLESITLAVRAWNEIGGEVGRFSSVFLVKER